MRTKCERHDRALVGRRLERPEQAAEALRLSASRPYEECVVVLVCDTAREVLLALDFVDAPVIGAPQVMELLATALGPSSPSSVVVGLFNGEPDTFVVEELEAICDPAGIELVDVMVIDGDRWTSMFSP